MDNKRIGGSGAPPRLSARASLLDQKKTSPTTTTSSGNLKSLASTPSPISSTSSATLKTSSGIPSISTTPSSSSLSSSPTTSSILKSSGGIGSNYKTPPSPSLSRASSGLGPSSQHGRSSSSTSSSSLPSALLNVQHSRSTSSGLLPTIMRTPQMSRVQQGHSRKSSKGGSGASLSSRWGSNIPSYSDYVDEELFYSQPTEEDDEEFDQIRSLLNSEYSITTVQSTGVLKSGNLVVLSWKGSTDPVSSAVVAAEPHDEQQENDQRDLNFIKDTLSKADSMSKQMVFILDKFNNGLTSLDKNVAPINASMNEWSSVYNNITATMDSLRATLEKFDISRIEAKIKEGAKGDYESYMQALEQVGSSIDFLQSNSSFKSADRTLSQLIHLKQHGLGELENNFKSLLLKISNIIDPTTIPKLSGTSKRYLSIISPSAVEKISKSIQLFSKLHYHSFLKEYKDKRSKFILNSLRKMSPDKFLKSTLETKNLAYVKGSHPLISYCTETLRLYQIESDLAKELFGDQYHTILEEIIDPSHELLLETTEPMIKFKKSATDKVFGIFPLLDLFDTFTRLLPDFQSAISSRDGKHLAELKDIIKNLESTCSSLLDFNLDDESSSGSSKKELNTIPTVDEITSNRLIEFKGSVEFLLSKTKSSSFNEFLERILKSLIKYLQTRSRKDFPSIPAADFYKVPIKSNIFLLNNYKYIVGSLKSSNIIDQSSNLFKEFELCLDNEIKVFQDFWQVLVEQLKFNKSKDDNKSIIKKHSSFLKTITELSKLKFDIPDQDLREQLKKDAQSIVDKTYDRFKEICRLDKIHLEKNFTPFESTDDINRKIERIFEYQ
eukprot:gene5956-7418_t